MECCILDAINRGTTRPKDIYKYIPEASKRILEMQLSELLFYGIIEKSMEDMYPKETHYGLTAAGKSILPIHSDFVKAKQQKLEEVLK